jgi:hypothetical protein
VEAVLTNSLRTNVSSANHFASRTRAPLQAGVLLDRRDRFAHNHDADDDAVVDLNEPPSIDIAIGGVQISPREVTKRRTFTSAGMAAEIIQTTRRAKVEYRYRGPLHLIVVYEQGHVTTASRSSRVCPGPICTISGRSSRSFRPAMSTTSATISRR